MNVNQWLGGQQFGIYENEMVGFTTSQMLTYIYNKVDAYFNMCYSHEHISGYQSDLVLDSNRVVMRVGFDDANYNGTFQPGEEWDYHF